MAPSVARRPDLDIEVGYADPLRSIGLASLITLGFIAHAMRDTWHRHIDRNPLLLAIGLSVFASFASATSYTSLSAISQLFIGFFVLFYILFGVVMCGIDDEYWRLRKQRHLSQGFDDDRANQLVFQEWYKVSSELFVSHIWFDILAFITGPADVLQTRHGRNTWLRDFMPPSSSVTSTGFIGKPSENFETSRSHFDIHPSKFVDCLEAFAKDLATQDLANAMMTYVSDSHNQFERLKCWTKLQGRISELMKDPSDLSNPILDANSEANPTSAFDDLEQAYEFLQSYEATDGQGAKAAEQASRFLERYVVNGRPYEKKTASTWKLERLRHLADILHELHAEEQQFRASTWVLFIKNYNKMSTVKEISSHLKKLALTETPLSAVHHQFQLNVCEFLKQITGDDNIEYNTARKRLRDVANRQQKTEAFYKIIEKQRSEISQQQQIITCLGYRHVLEMLPNPTFIKIQFPGSSPTSATQMWQMTWQLAVEKELLAMLKEYIERHQPGTIIPTPTAPAGSDPQKNLRLLFDNDFRYWTKKRNVHSKIMNNSGDIAKGIASVGASTTTSSKGTSGGRAVPTGTRTGAHTSLHTPLFQSLNLEYAEWHVYERGLGLYSELSSSIHGYDRQYTVDETNWAKSDWLILSWLTPKTDSSGKVQWDDAWNDRKLS